MADDLPEGTDTIVTDETPLPGGDRADEGFDRATEEKASAGSGAATDGGFADRLDAWRTQGYDKAREYAEIGKERTTGAIDDLLTTINDAADQVDARLGGQYGDYARRAAESLGGFNDALKGKDVDALFADARDLIAKAPAIAIGTAAVLGFVVARLARAGADRPAAPDDKL